MTIASNGPSPSGPLFRRVYCLLFSILILICFFSIGRKFSFLNFYQQWKALLTTCRFLQTRAGPHPRDQGHPVHRQREEGRGSRQEGHRRTKGTGSSSNFVTYDVTPLNLIMTDCDDLEIRWWKDYLAIHLCLKCSSNNA